MTENHYSELADSQSVGSIVLTRGEAKQLVYALVWLIADQEPYPVFPDDEAAQSEYLAYLNARLNEMRRLIPEADFDPLQRYCQEEWADSADCIRLKIMEAEDMVRAPNGGMYAALFGHEVDPSRRRAAIVTLPWSNDERCVFVYAVELGEFVHSFLDDRVKSEYRQKADTAFVEGLDALVEGILGAPKAAADLRDMFVAIRDMARTGDDFSPAMSAAREIIVSAAKKSRME